MASRHRRRSTAGQDLAMMIQLRPKQKEVVERGILQREDVMTAMDDDGDDDDDDGIKEEEGDGDDGEVHKVSIVSSLLFATISSALRRSCLETTKQEKAVFAEMQSMNAEMKLLRQNLDQFFLSENPDISSFAAEEDSVRDRFHGLQSKLLRIASKQQSMKSKLVILHSVERGMMELQNVYDREIGELRQREETLLHDLRASRRRRKRAVKVMSFERSHQEWTAAKLQHNREVAMSQPMLLERGWVAELDGFVDALKKVAEEQKQRVSDYDDQIEQLEQRLLRIRHDVMKVRTMTFKRIYDLHREVELAESLDLGMASNRRLSVASPTELERERRHHSTKIQRQISTLMESVKGIENERKKQKKNKNEMEMANKQRLAEMVEVQSVMSDHKLKCFFCVFVQTANQTLCDAELMFHHLNSQEIHNGVTTKEHLDKITNLCQSLYGINCVIDKMNDNKHSLSLNDKLRKCSKFMLVLKRALAKQYRLKSMKQVPSHRLSLIVIYVARKLCVHEHVVDEIERTHDQQIPRLAEIRAKDIFQAIIADQNIFRKHRKPSNIKEASHAILENVFGIRC